MKVLLILHIAKCGLVRTKKCMTLRQATFFLQMKNTNLRDNQIQKVAYQKQSTGPKFLGILKWALLLRSSFERNFGVCVCSKEYSSKKMLVTGRFPSWLFVSSATKDWLGSACYES